jgi:hypothetical protein
MSLTCVTMHASTVCGGHAMRALVLGESLSPSMLEYMYEANG